VHYSKQRTNYVTVPTMVNARTMRFSAKRIEGQVIQFYSHDELIAENLLLPDLHTRGVSAA
jgi:hypothetical protein